MDSIKDIRTGYHLNSFYVLVVKATQLSFNTRMDHAKSSWNTSRCVKGLGNPQQNTASGHLRGENCLSYRQQTLHLLVLLTIFLDFSQGPLHSSKSCWGSP